MTFLVAAVFSNTAVGEEIAVDSSKVVDLKPEAIKFVPPPPPRKAPVLEEKSVSIHDRQTHQIAVIRAGASDLPDVPEAVERVPPAQPPEVPDLGRRKTISLSVTVYDKQISFVKWRDAQADLEFEAWCGWDWSLVAPIGEFETEGTTFTLIFTPGHVDTSKNVANPLSGTLPELQDGEFAFTQESSTEAKGATLLEAVRDYYLANKVKLQEVQLAREVYRKEKGEWEKANPKEPQNHTIWFKPHRGSRYLNEESQP